LQASTGMAVVEVLADSPWAAQNELNTMPEVKSVTQLGIRLRVLVPNSVTDPLGLVSGKLNALGISAECRLVDASLEEVFVAVTLKDSAQDQAA